MIKVILQNEHGRNLIAYRFTLVPTLVGNLQQALGLQGSEALIPTCTGKGAGLFQEPNKALGLVDLGAIRAIHVAGEPYHHPLDLMRSDQRL
jgi:hypothetical protein